MKPVYLIVNIHRSGSSMLMRCLEAGGLKAVFDKSSDSMNHSAPKDYIPNPNGFYQFNGEINPLFYEMNKGKLIKFPIREISKLPQGEYKIILLKRNPKEIRASMAKWTPFQSWGNDEAVTYIYNKYMNGIKTILEQRNDVDLIEVNYKDIVNSPLETFEYIRDSGWGINSELCAEKVDSSLYRNNLERDKK